MAETGIIKYSNSYTWTISIQFDKNFFDLLDVFSWLKGYSDRNRF